MSKRTEFRPKDFNKFHQKEKLETIIKDCWKCGKTRPYVYVGEENGIYLYDCLFCGIRYSSAKKLK